MKFNRDVSRLFRRSTFWVSTTSGGNPQGLSLVARFARRTNQCQDGGRISRENAALAGSSTWSCRNYHRRRTCPAACDLRQRGWHFRMSLAFAGGL